MKAFCGNKRKKQTIQLSKIRGESFNQLFLLKQWFDTVVLSITGLPHSIRTSLTAQHAGLTYRTRLLRHGQMKPYPHFHNDVCALVTLTSPTHQPSVCLLKPNPTSGVAGSTYLWMKTLKQPITTQNLNIRVINTEICSFQQVVWLSFSFNKTSIYLYLWRLIFL